MPHKICAVCGQLGEGWHFGAFVCRPCASFFRRTMAENKAYDCRHNNQCPINRESRNCCRSCRLKKCLDSGMKCTPSKPVEQQPSTSPNAVATVSDQSQNSNSNLFENNPENGGSVGMENLPILRKVYDFIKSYYNSIQSIYACENPSSCFKTVTSAPIDRETYVRLEKVAVSIMGITLSSYFPFFGNRNESFKMDILEVINFRLQCLSKMLLSIQNFPDDDDKSAAWYGYHIDMKNPEFFFGNIDQSMVSYFKDAIKCVRIVVNRYAKSNIVELDIGIISALVLINQILKIESNNVEAQQFKATLINEYHSYLANRFGTELGIQRFTETLFMMNDTAFGR
uniref:Nuclear receptor domain-containing protein n=1 Tax=Panagrolaimus superbus TaxID=310955 RepID=A0A914ZBI3_9BILA